MPESAMVKRFPFAPWTVATVPLPEIVILPVTAVVFSEAIQFSVLAHLINRETFEKHPYLNKSRLTV
jgi:hypothetical protein